MLPVAVFWSRVRARCQPARRVRRISAARPGARVLAFGLIETLVIAALGLRLTWFQQPSESPRDRESLFFLLIGASITPVLVYLAFRQFAEAMGRPWMPMVIMLAGVGTERVFSTGFFNLRAARRGRRSDSRARESPTLISRTLGTAVIYFWLSRDAQLSAALPPRWFAPLSRARLLEMLASRSAGVGHATLRGGRIRGHRRS